MTPIVELREVSKTFSKPVSVSRRLLQRVRGTQPEVIRAVDKVSFSIQKGEVLGLAGESGCGKSTVGRLVSGLLKPTGGEVLHEGLNQDQFTPSDAKRIGLRTQMIFQNPFSSLNPRMRIRHIIGEAAVVHGVVSRKDIDDYVNLLLNQVGIDIEFRDRLPHQFSGGQRQRIGVARALAVKPEFLVCDEPVAALDVSIQAQVLNLFMNLRSELGLTYLFISHDLSVVEHISDRVAIMYLGRIVETAPTPELFSRQLHPYTAALLASVPQFSDTQPVFHAIRGEIPSPINPPSGCHFHPRCPMAAERCRSESPLLREVGPGRHSACHFSEDVPQNLDEH